MEEGGEVACGESCVPVAREMERGGAVQRSEPTSFEIGL